MKMKFDKERKIVVEAGKEMLEKKLTVGTWGNISLRTFDKEKCVITPSGMNYQKMNPEDMVVIDLDGKVVEGKWKPSSELEMHCEIYGARKDVNAIVHTHPVFSSVLAVLKEDLPPIIEDMVMLLGGEVKVTEYTLPGTKELAEKAANALGDRNAVLLANHGAVCVGPDMKRTLTACKVLEKSAQIYVYSKMIGQPTLLSPGDVKKLREASMGYLKLWGQK
jgi:L-fuculose-phosphate aldolase